jgi:hypothetical protein
MAELQIRSILELCDHFKGRGEQAHFDGTLLSLPTTVDGRTIACEVLWGAQPGLVQFVAAVPLDIPPERRVAVAQELTDVNSNTVLPCFQLRLVDGAWRVFVLMTLFQAADNAISASAAERCLLACRNSVTRYLPQLQAVAAPVPVPDVTTERPLTLDAAGAARLRKLAGVDAGASLAEVVQPFFARSRILAARGTKGRVYLAAPATGDAFVLSGQPDNLHRLVGIEAPAGISERARAAAYAMAADRWLSTVDQVQEQPTVFRTAVGFVVSLWAVDGKTRVYRELLVMPDGRVLRTEHTAAP